MLCRFPGQGRITVTLIDGCFDSLPADRSVRQGLGTGKSCSETESGLSIAEDERGMPSIRGFGESRILLRDNFLSRLQ